MSTPSPSAVAVEGARLLRAAHEALTTYQLHFQAAGSYRPAIDDLALFSIIDTEVGAEGSGVVLTTSADQAMATLIDAGQAVVHDSIVMEAMAGDAHELLVQLDLIREADT